MVFSSPTFLFLFLPAVLLAAWLTPGQFRRYLLLVASLGFYWWGVQEFVLVIAGSTLVDWALAQGIAARRARAAAEAPASPAARAGRLLLWAGLAQNLGLLAYFKYGEFGSVQAQRLADVLGLGSPAAIAVALPIGISFFTFEKISYLVDVYRGDVEARTDPLDLLLFVSFFPRSIAGPITRLREVGPALRHPEPSIELASEGATRFAHGLAKKVLIADQIAPIADTCFASASDGTLTLGAAWLGAVAYSLQLYFDFSGYSDMAIGIALMLGIRLPENFNRPYSAYSLTDFWRRWHITLSRWFRDYVYVPLGGNRDGRWRADRNLLIVFALTGFWHGAAWSFLLLGLYHGIWIVAERRTGLRAVVERPRWPVARRAALHVILVIGWVLFRAESVPVATSYYAAMFTPEFGLTPEIRAALTNQALLTLALASLVVVLPRDRASGWLMTPAPGRIAVAVRAGLVAIVLPVSLAVAFASTFSPFLYFQF